MPLEGARACSSDSIFKTIDNPSKAGFSIASCTEELDCEPCNGNRPSIFDGLSFAISSFKIGSNEIVVDASEVSPEQK